MCRLLLVRDPGGIDPNPHLDAFRQLSRDSREFQGHGWGCAWLEADGSFAMHHRIDPVWQDPTRFPRTSLFLAHARSAFRDEGIVVENNMPFGDGDNVFLFNGELQGVRIRAEGRIGAEKIFNTVKRFYRDEHRGDYRQAVERGVRVINHKTRYVRAMNFFLANARTVQVCSQFSEDPDYFQMRFGRDGDTLAICSQSYDCGNLAWERIANHQVLSLDLETEAVQT